MLPTHHVRMKCTASSVNCHVPRHRLSMATPTSAGIFYNVGVSPREYYVISCNWREQCNWHTAIAVRTGVDKSYTLEPDHFSSCKRKAGMALPDKC